MEVFFIRLKMSFFFNYHELSLIKQETTSTTMMEYGEKDVAAFVVLGKL